MDLWGKGGGGAYIYMCIYIYISLSLSPSVFVLALPFQVFGLQGLLPSNLFVFVLSVGFPRLGVPLKGLYRGQVVFAA